MSLRCGIVGLPNAGKSTIFNALTHSNVAAENYPFCTIKPNFGIVKVPDFRLGKLTKLVNPERVIHANIEFIDIAGLVPGASKGDGLGNQFLSHIRETNAILNVFRCFENINVPYSNGGNINPISDIEIIETELILADIQTAERMLFRFNKIRNQENSNIIKVLETCIDNLNIGKSIRTLDIFSKNYSLLSSAFITAKPILYIANVDDNASLNKKLLNEIDSFVKKRQSGLIKINASLESEIVNLTNEDRLFIAMEMGIQEPALNHLIRFAFNLLGLQTYFTVGNKEVRAWTIPINTTASRAAGIIHSDFERGFIRAQTISYKDFIEFKGEIGAKKAGKLRLEGKEYLVNDGDIMHFLFNI
ncbi:MAG: redox-regulated ATPase YchF [Bordetella sp.]|nr:MAG: redox-regulated ATPase YchF [Bordetella sp.]